MNFDGICYCLIFLQNLIHKIHVYADCSLDIASSGTITSPNYPKDYDNNLDLTYTIRSPSGRPMTLVFLDFEVENGNCNYDYLEIKDGDHKESRKVCGYSLPDPFVAMSGIVVVRLHTDYSIKYKGFNAYFNDSRGCSIGMVNMTYGMLTSPNYPRDYENNLDYTFTIRTLNNRPIILVFLDFEVGNGNCDYDYVQLHDGDDVQQEKVCGNALPNSFVAFSGVLIVQFHTSNKGTHKGFEAYYYENLEHELPDVTHEQYSTSTVSTSLSSTEFESNDSTAIEFTPTTLSEASSTSETNTQLFLKGQIERKSSVPVIIGTVVGFVVLTILAILLILWYLRKKTASKKPPQTAFSNENYNIHYTKGSRTDNVSYQNGDTGYCNVENGKCTINTIDPNYDFATAISTEHKNITNNDDGVQESEYVEQEDSYNILNVHPSKSGNTEMYDRTTDGVYDSAKQEKDDMEIGLYDHTPNSPDHEYDITVNIKRSIDYLYN